MNDAQKAALTARERKQYADLIGQCQHNHDSSCSDHYNDVARAALTALADARLEVATLKADTVLLEACREWAQGNPHHPACKVPRLVQSADPPPRHWRCNCGLRAHLAQLDERLK